MKGGGGYESSKEPAPSVDEGYIAYLPFPIICPLLSFECQASRIIFSSLLPFLPLPLSILDKDGL